MIYYFGDNQGSREGFQEELRDQSDPRGGTWVLYYWDDTNNKCLYDIYHMWGTVLDALLVREEKVKVRLLSCAQLFSTTWTVANQAPPSMGFSRQEY